MSLLNLFRRGQKADHRHVFQVVERRFLKDGRIIIIRQCAYCTKKQKHVSKPYD